MDNINSFSINRVFQLIVRQLNMSMKPFIIGISASAGFLIGISVLGILASGGSFNLSSFTYLGYVIIFLGGYIFSSRIFNELQSPLKSHFYLTLPARPEEKLIASWIISSPLFIIVSLLILFLTSFLISGTLSVFFDKSLNVFQPFSGSALKTSGVYMVTQTIFLLGSVYFKKYNFLKTLLAIFVVYIAIFVWVVIVVFAIIRPQEFVMGFSEEHFFDFSFKFDHMGTFFTYLFWCIIPIFFLVVSYLRLKERQV